MSVETRVAKKQEANGKPADVFDLYLREDDEDRRSLRVSLFVAVVVHLVLLAVTLPALSGPVIPDADDPVVYLLQPPPRYKKPPVDPPKNPQKEVVAIPMPDDTPHDEEPLVLDEPVKPDPLPIDDLGVLPIPDAPPAMPSDEPIRVGEIERPERVYSVDPAYTEVARRARIQGVVILEAIIDKSGGVKDVKVLKPLPMGLTEAAVAAVKQWRYTPSAMNGKPVEVKMTVTVIFSLN